MLVMAKRKPEPKQAEPDRHVSPKLQFHLPNDLRSALEDYCRKTRPQPTLTAVLKLALEEFLERAGCWPPVETDDN